MSLVDNTAAAVITVGRALPTFTYTCFADDNESVSRLAINVDGSVEVTEDGEWSPEEPDSHTESATLDIAWPNGAGDTVLELTGDDHRDFENHDLLDGLLIRIANGQPPHEALEATRAEAAKLN